MILITWHPIFLSKEISLFTNELLTLHTKMTLHGLLKVKVCLLGFILVKFINNFYIMMPLNDRYVILESTGASVSERYIAPTGCVEIVK